MMLFFDSKNFLSRFTVGLVIGIACLTALAAVVPSSDRTEWDSLWLKFDQKNVGNNDFSDAEFELICNALFEMSKNDDFNTLSDAAKFEKLGFLFDKKFQPERALKLKQRVLEIYKKILGPEHTQTVRAKNNLAYTYSLLNEPEKALPLLLEVLDLHRKSLGMDSQSAAQVLSNLAIVYGELGQPNEMLPLAIQALSIREKKLGTEHPDTADSLSDVADIYRELGQSEKGLPLDIRALAIREKVFGKSSPKVALSLGNMATFYSNKGDYQKAVELQKRAVAINERSLGPEHPVTALALSNLAVSYSFLRQYEAALPITKRALEIREKTLGPEHPLTAISLNNLASLYGQIGQNENAIQLQAQALEVFLINPENSKSAFAMFSMAGLLEKTGNPSAAIIWGKRGVNLYQSIRSKVAVLGSESLKAYTDSVESHYQELANVLVAQGRLPEAQQVLDMLKEEEQFELIQRSAQDDPRRTRMFYTQSEQRWMSRYDEIANSIAALGIENRELRKAERAGALTATQIQRKKKVNADLEVARQAFLTYTSELQSYFSTKGPAQRDEKEETSAKTLQELQALIRNLENSSHGGVALVQYFMTEEQVTILLTTPDTQITRSSKIGIRDLNHMISDFRRQLRDPRSQSLQTSQALYKLLVAPIAKDLEQTGSQTVMLSLNGALRYLPFSALHDGNQYLVQRWRLPLYTSVVRDRLRDEMRPQWHVAGLGLTRAIDDFPALPAVRDEIQSIVKTNARASGVLPGEVYLDEAFSGNRLKEAGRHGFEVLHIASHFRFSPGTEVNSYLMLGDGQHLTLGDIRKQGYRFDQVDMLTLSACDTALGGGRDEKGREIEGFGVIAQQQGAKSVLATLWPVSDVSTAVLMSDLYRRRQALNLSKSEALRQSQVALLEGKYPHPFYWAPFILMGNWK